jgi:hypothetical protein
LVDGLRRRLRLEEGRKGRRRDERVARAGRVGRKRVERERRCKALVGTGPKYRKRKRRMTSPWSVEKTKAGVERKSLQRKRRRRPKGR